MATGFILALIIPAIIGWFLGLGFYETLFFIITPAMSGGIAGGILPLALGYSSVTGIAYGELVAILTPASILANFLAIGGAALMNQIGNQKPALTGNGTLVKSENLSGLSKKDRESRPISYQLIGTGLFLVLTLYIAGTILESVTGLPTAVIIIFIATMLKYFQILPENIEEGAVQLFRTLSTSLNTPVMVAIGIVFLSLEDVLAILSWQYLVVLFSVVLTLGLNGYFMSRFTDMYPVESTIVFLNQASMGGTGNIAILTTANREEMMPFTQVATRIGGAITISLMIIALRVFI
jgi:Na+/citrate or Na+/malate symporter